MVKSFSRRPFAMMYWQFTDIFPVVKALLHKPFGDEPSPLHFGFQAAYVR